MAETFFYLFKCTFIATAKILDDNLNQLLVYIEYHS